MSFLLLVLRSTKVTEHNYKIMNILKLSLLCLLCASVHAETHANLQSVTETGTSAWEGTLPFTIRGIITTTSDEMLDSTPNYLPWDDGANSGKMGAEWQIVIQAVDEGDVGGTLMWLGQNYGNQPWIRDESLSYTDEAWEAELLRVRTDPDTGYVFQPGDCVEVTVRKCLFYGGKRNINEAHSNTVENNFDVHLVQAGYGLPDPEAITLSDLVLPDETGSEQQVNIFDQTRQTGGERYQGVRVRLNGLQLVQFEGWNPEGTWAERRNNVVTDGESRYFTVRYPRRDLGTAPTGTFDAIGIINQESGSSTDGTMGYEFFIQEVIQSIPTLQIASSGVIRWSADFGEDWVLESAETLDGTWSVVTETPVQQDGFWCVSVDMTTGQHFYRLKQN